MPLDLRTRISQAYAFLSERLPEHEAIRLIADDLQLPFNAVRETLFDVFANQGASA